MFESRTVKMLSEIELLITLSYNLDCIVDVFIPWWEAQTELFKDSGFYVKEPYWSKTYALSGISLPFKITLRFIFNEETEEVSSADIINAECLNNLDY